jgi:hypothetical protein
MQGFVSVNALRRLTNRRDWLLQIGHWSLVIAGYAALGMNEHMKLATCVIEVKVLAHWLIQRFAGEAILAAADPRFVVALLVAKTQTPFSVEGTHVTFATHRVAFFAISSIVKVFAESDVIGKRYRLSVTQREIDGTKSYSIGVVN